jgi:hypothetical protein
MAIRRQRLLLRCPRLQRGIVLTALLLLLLLLMWPLLRPC